MIYIKYKLILFNKIININKYMKNINIDKSNMIAILNFIKEQEKVKDNEKKWRKATEMDILGKITNTQGVLIDNRRLSTNKKVVKDSKKNGDKVTSFRMQEEFGPKKRIKP
jgi:hypothetical protein